MPKFLREINVTIPAGGRELKFQSTEDMTRWLDVEDPFWRSVDTKKMYGNLRSYWQQQQQFFPEARQYVQQFEEKLAAGQEQEASRINDDISNHFNKVGSEGKVITSDWEVFPVIVDLAKSDLDAAGLVYVMARQDAAQTLGQVTNLGIPFKTLLNLILLYGRSKGTRDWLSPQRKELTALKSDYQGQLNDARTAFDAQEGVITEQREHAQQAHEDRKRQWNTFKEEMSTQWDALKKVYDEQLALLAPTQYWGNRATTHRNVAIGFATAFGVVLVASMGIFVWLAMPHLFDVAVRKDVSPLLTLIPIVVPAFAGIWVLKILSRLLSENMQLMRDAKERETMVKTFLALLRDDKNGKSIVNDNDRILILHSLFRPSSVNAVDDAPPVHWFDILTNKVTGKGSM
jgi:hypothetical protein